MQLYAQMEEALHQSKILFFSFLPWIVFIFFLICLLLLMDGFPYLIFIYKVFLIKIFAWTWNLCDSDNWRSSCIIKLQLFIKSPLHLNSPKLYSIKNKFNQSFDSPKIDW
jgi:hypothetical protein